jgi:hypothetical protein
MEDGMGKVLGVWDWAPTSAGWADHARNGPALQWAGQAAVCFRKAAGGVKR